MKTDDETTIPMIQMINTPTNCDDDKLVGSGLARDSECETLTTNCTFLSEYRITT